MPDTEILFIFNERDGFTNSFESFAYVNDMLFGPNRGSAQTNLGDSLGPLYSNWEAEYLMMCICDWGLFGPECETRMCPKGFDPLLHSGLHQREINITTNATNKGSSLNGIFIMTFNGFSFEFNANATQF